MNNTLERSAGIEFWFDFGSNYSYLSVMRIGELARRNNVAITWRPVLLGPIFKSFGWETSPFVLQEEKGRYVWTDMARQCEKFGLPWQRPSTFPRHSLLPVRVALSCANEPWIEDFCKRVMLRNFAADQDINDEQSVAGMLAQSGCADPAAAVAAAQGEANKLKLKEQTARAKALGVFGAPTFFVNGEMFWGNDRLADAIEFASRS